MTNTESTCSYPRCPHTPSTPENIKRGRCSLHPPTVAAPGAARTASRALSAPVIAAAPEQPVAPFIEIPDTPDGWEDVRREIGARLDAYLEAPQVLTCEGGEVHVQIEAYAHEEAAFSPARHGYNAILTGRVSVGRRHYWVYGGQPDHAAVMADTKRGRMKEGVQELLIIGRVSAAWQADGPHARCRALYEAYQSAAEASKRKHGGLGISNSPERIAETQAAAAHALLRLAAVELQGPARVAALQLAGGEFPGTVQDMLDAVASVTAVQGRTTAG